jgi:hypothetical protein
VASVVQSLHELPVGRIIFRGFVAAHGALLGAVYLLVLHAPLQVTSAIWQSVQGSTFAPGREPEPERIVLTLALAGVTFLLGLAVFFIFPFIQGGVLGQVRGRLESPAQPAKSFGACGRSHYTRLLGSQALFTLVMLAVIVPVMVFAAVLAIQETAAGGAPPAPDQINRQLLRHPAMLAVMAIAVAVMSVVGLIYWVANCVVVAEQENTMAAWRRGFAFCRRNASAVLVLWLVNLAVGLLLAPLGMLGQLGVVTAWWALSALAVMQSVVIGYWGVVLAGMCMSLYLDRRTLSELPETAALSAKG